MLSRQTRARVDEPLDRSVACWDHIDVDLSGVQRGRCAVLRDAESPSRFAWRTRLAHARAMCLSVTSNDRRDRTNAMQTRTLPREANCHSAKTPFANSVSCVVERSSKKQMLNSDTRRVVAVMADEKAFRNGAVCKLPRNAMCCAVGPIEPESSVAERVETSRPDEAVPSGNHLRPEPVEHGTHLCRVCVGRLVGDSSVLARVISGARLHCTGALGDLALTRRCEPGRGEDLSVGPHLDRVSIRRRGRLTILFPLFERRMNHMKLSSCLPQREPPSDPKFTQLSAARLHVEVIATILSCGKDFGCGSDCYQARCS